MRCPECGGATHVYDSRMSGDETRRRRECDKCKHRFTTFEVEAKQLRIWGKLKAMLPPTEEEIRKMVRLWKTIKGEMT